jgi:hypothetical protein
VSEAQAGVLDALRAAGAPQRDPLRWHFLERLHARALTQSPAVQRVLQTRLAHALAECQESLACGPLNGAAASARASAQTLRGPLGELVRSLEHAGAPHVAQAPDPQRHSTTESTTPNSSSQELKSVRQFRNTWSKLSADKQLNLALAQAPKNAGPINSHMLVLRSLALMREAAPDYLNRFVSYADTLLCLEQAAQERSVAAKPAKPRVRRARA